MLNSMKTLYRPGASEGKYSYFSNSVIYILLDAENSPYNENDRPPASNGWMKEQTLIVCGVLPI